MDPPREFRHMEILSGDRFERDETRLASSSSLARMLRSSFSILLLGVLPSYVTANEFECGVNRFNNESPLTERIVGGNNSLQ